MMSASSLNAMKIASGFNLTVAMSNAGSKNAAVRFVARTMNAPSGPTMVSIGYSKNAKRNKISLILIVSLRMLKHSTELSTLP
jgi:hypothetical protein